MGNSNEVVGQGEQGVDICFTPCVPVQLESINVDICLYMCTYKWIYKYIYIERERGRDGCLCFIFSVPPQ